jgi:hypothetical protein
MIDRTQAVFGNPISAKTRRQAEKAKAGYIREFGDDSGTEYRLGLRAIPALAGLGTRELTVSAGPEREGEAIDLAADGKALVIGNIRMGFGHYRISMAIASAARQRGLNPYWFDLHAFEDTPGGKVIEKLNGLYSMGSRWSQKYPLFNRLYWEPLNSEGFRKLSYNAKDQKVAELLASPCGLLPRDVPYVATHAWPAQAAVHAGLSRVVNVIPDNWPMALHLSEGAIHCVQSPSAWQGYKMLRGMQGEAILKPMPEGSLRYTGHYVDHEIVANIEADTAARLARARGGETLRVLLTIGGAGAQRELFEAIIRKLLPEAEKGRACLLVNLGDHRSALEAMLKDIPELSRAILHDGDWEGTKAFAEAGLSGEMRGVHLFHDADIYAAVYATNLLMRASDLMVTKPSELAYYPVPKLHIKRVGGHEAWGAIRSAEIGDGSIECSTVGETLAMLDLLLGDKEGLYLMNDRILAANAAGQYSGAYRAVDIALGRD